MIEVPAFRSAGFRGAVVAGAVGLALLAPGLVAARDRSPTEVLNAPGRFDGQTIVLAGTISNVKERQTTQGQRYYLFDVDDGIRAINVIKVGVLPCGSGGYAVVEGAFQRTREFDKETFRNQIKAWRVVCR
jgi:cytochrome c-type biogenesis protein CcmE